MDDNSFKSMSEIKTLLILSTPPPYGGGEIRNSYLSDYFEKKKGFRCLNVGKKKQEKGKQGALNIKNVIHAIRSIFRIISEIKKTRPKVVYLSLPKTYVAFLKVLPVIIYCSTFKVKMVGDLAGRMFYFLEGNFFVKRTGLYFLNKLTIIKVLSQQIQKDITEMGLRNARFINNGVYLPEKYYQKKKLPADNSEKINFVYTGMLADYKGTEILVNSFIKLAKEFNNIALILIGEWQTPAYKDKIFEILNSSGISDRIYIKGIKKDDEKWNILKSAHVYVHPTNLDGQPLSILEALGFGLPVIATPVGAIPETIIDSVNGFIIPRNNNYELYTVMKKIISDKYLYNQISENNMNRYIEFYTSEGYCKRMENIFNLLVI